MNDGDSQNSDLSEWDGDFLSHEERTWNDIVRGKDDAPSQNKAQHEFGQNECKPADPLPTKSADVIQSEIADVIADICRTVAPQDFLGEDSPPAFLIRGGVGVGKTVATAEETAKAAFLDNKRIQVRLPTISMADQFKAAVLRCLPDGADPSEVVVHRGLSQLDPSNEGATMCPRSSDVETAMRAGGGIDNICGNTKSGFCQFHPKSEGSTACGYMTQSGADARIVITAGDVSLIGGIPNRVKRKGDRGDRQFDLVVIDETSPAALMKGFDAPIEAPIENIRVMAQALQTKSRESWSEGHLDKAADLDEASTTLSNLSEVVEHNFDNGGVTVDNITGAGLNEDRLSRARISVFKLKLDVPICTHLTGEALKKDLSHIARKNSAVSRTAGILEALSQGLGDHLKSGNTGLIKHCLLGYSSGRLSSTGDAVMAAKLRYRGRLGEHIKQATVLILDASADEVLLRAWWPNLELRYNEAAKDGEGVKRYQITDRRMSYSAALPKDYTDSDTSQAKKLHRLSLLGNVYAKAVGETAVFLPLRGELWIDENVSHRNFSMGHFGDLRGRNDWENVAASVVYARPSLSPRAAEDLAEVMMGVPVQPIEPDESGRVLYEQETKSLPMRDGSIVPVKVERHPDPLAEAVRRSVTDSELGQTEGRPRAARRSVSRPLISTVLTTAEIGHAIDGTFTYAEFKAQTDWPTALLLDGIWVAGSKARWTVTAEIIKALADRGIENNPSEGSDGDFTNHGIEKCAFEAISQRRTFLYSTLIEKCAFEGFPKKLKDASRRNPELADFIYRTTEAISSGKPSVQIMFADFPLADFRQFSVRLFGSRYSADVFTTDESKLERLLPSAQIMPARGTKSINPKGL